MFKKIQKRDGKIVTFNPEKITDAIAAAGAATGEFKYDRAKALTEKVLKIAEEEIKNEGGEEIEVSAQVRVSDFYKKLGYNEVGNVYFDEYCEHIKMVKGYKGEEVCKILIIVRQQDLFSEKMQLKIFPM